MNFTGIQVAHVRLIRPGVEIDNGSGTDTVTRTFFPPLDNPSTSTLPWEEVGDVSVSSDQPNLGTSIEIIRKKPFSTQMERRKEIRNGPISRTLTFTVLNRTNVLTELHLMTGPIDDSATAEGQQTPVDPFAGGANPIAGWFGVSYFDEEGHMLTNERHWGELRLGQPLAGGPAAQVTPQYVLQLFPDNGSSGSVLKKEI
jgi:hypothetical protein